MRYIGSAKIKPGASLGRLCTLMRAIEALSDEMAFDPHQARFEFAVSDDLSFWIRAGGANTFRQDFSDVIDGFCSFRRERHTYKRAVALSVGS